jgi:hypothetical protein
MHRPLATTLFTAFLGLAGLGAYKAYEARGKSAPRVLATVVPSDSAPAPPPGTVPDPLLPDRPMRLASSHALPSGDEWIAARPQFQYSHTAAQRGGIEPCATQAVDMGAFDPLKVVGSGKLLMPQTGALDGNGAFDLVIHLHGEQPVARELALSGQKFVLYTITFDPSESYAPLFNAAGALSQLTSQIESAVGQQSGVSAHVRHLVLSAWSAGFVGIEAALAQPQQRPIDAVVLIDGLHAPRGNRPAFEAQLKPFVTYAERAARGDGWFFVSHSSIDPIDFASTTECAHYLIAELGGKPQAVERKDALGLELVEAFDRGAFFVRGYAGNDKADHCAQLGTLRDVFTALGRRFRR